mmetsp:Transcript_4300/g.12524  ORF Transcript_4300/g.12524 Transcript_4300/m.12524 type:complete len:128 (-) Transcript_4300:155-538(-)|eukprot:CAMPEP_0118853178 /NCGR_PEP_ID=MMETSP1163-20130328/1865_1 /TAXON_ID=124430 /ORGANISM="Phaeomonas parva, Strain CCMP2877" /LENGTH=127 /DNA_ID=CAMNT_0006785685 /DNA_START=68 /DNA_END=454 /DNA_ORIENTATION=-
MSSWFGFGGNKDDDKGSSSYDQPMGGSSGFADSGTDFGPSLGSSAPSMGGSTAIAGLDIRSQLMAERQKAELQAVIGALAELAFDQCISKPSTSLGSSERSCIESVVGKYLDTNEFVLMRMTRGGKK